MLSVPQLLKKYLAPHRWLLAGLSLLMLVSLAAQLARPQILRQVLDLSLAGDAYTSVIRGIMLLGVIAVLGHLADALVLYGSDRLGWAATNALRHDLTQHCLRLDMSFHKSTSPGELIERVDVDVTRLAGLLANFVRHIVINALFIVGSVALLWREHFSAGLIYALYTTVCLVVLSRVRRITTPYVTAERKATAGVYGFIGEQLATTEDIQGVGGLHSMLARLRTKFYQWLPHRIKAYIAFTSLWSTAIVLETLNFIIAVGLAIFLWRDLGRSIGTAYLVVHYAELLQQPIRQIRMQLQELQRGAASLARINDLLRLNSLPRIDSGPVTLPSGALGIETQSLSFIYEGDTAKVLDEISFALPAGTVLGVLGRTGSGKTTLARLLTKQYEPTGGSLVLGGVDTTTLGVDTVRARISYVTQEVQVFKATVRDNLTFFDDSHGDEKLHEVMRELGLIPWFSGLREGLNTTMEAGSSGLSAGEGQLLALCRAFLRDPSLIVLDEASAKLDPITEGLIDRALKRLLAGRTGVIIAHRLSTLEEADYLLLLDNGRVVEFGARTDLERDPHSHYSQLRRFGLEEVLV